MCCDGTVTDNDTDPVELRSVAERLATEAADFVRRRRVEVFANPEPIGNATCGLNQHC